MRRAIKRVLKRIVRRLYWLLEDASDVPFAGRGAGVCILDQCKFQEPERISIGDHVYIGHGAYFAGHGGLTIGTNVAFGQHVSIYTTNHNYESTEFIPYDGTLVRRPVKIGDHTWIGARTLILPGVEIGEGVVIGAGSIVTRSIPSRAIAFGQPAKVVKYRDPETFERLKSERRFWMPREIQNMASSRRDGP